MGGTQQAQTPPTARARKVGLITPVEETAMSVQLMHNPIATRRSRGSGSPVRRFAETAQTAAPRLRGRVVALVDALLGSIAAAATGHLTGI